MKIEKYPLFRKTPSCLFSILKKKSFYLHRYILDRNEPTSSQEAYFFGIFFARNIFLNIRSEFRTILRRVLGDKSRINRNNDKFFLFYLESVYELISRSFAHYPDNVAMLK